MWQAIGMVAGGLVIGIIIMVLKGLLFAKAKDTAVKLVATPEHIAKLKEMAGQGIIPQSVVDKAVLELQKAAAEPFNAAKAIDGAINVSDWVKWSKTFAQEFSLRTIIIRLMMVLFIVGIVYGAGFYKGTLGKQPILNLQGKEEWIKLNDHYMHITPEGNMYIVASDQKTILKTIKVSDIASLKKALKPYGFVFEPAIVVGGGASKAGQGLEAGLGLRWAKYYKWYAQSAITSAGMYPFGIGYKITPNTTLGLYAGTGYKTLERGLFERFMFAATIGF